jgi:phosphosulfolactate phosphohydrolase-like enzyme
MKVSLNLENSDSNDVTIVVDALRASTTIITALENFQTIIPVKNIEDATKLASDNFAVLAGERGGRVLTLEILQSKYRISVVKFSFLQQPMEHEYWKD